MSHAVPTTPPVHANRPVELLELLRAFVHDRLERVRVSRAFAWLVMYRRGVLVVGQLALAALSNYLAFALRFDGRIPSEELDRFVQFLPWLLVARGVAFVPFRVYEGLWKYTSISDVCNIAWAVFTSTAVCAFLVARPALVGYPRSVLLIDALLLLLMLVGIRMARRIVARVSPRKDGRRVLIFGAGDAGAMIVGDMQDDSFGYVPLGFVDDNPAKVGQYIHGVKVLGRRADLPRLLVKLQPDEVLIAVPGTDRSTVRKIVQLLEPFKVPIKTLPGLRDILDGRVGVNQIRDLTVEDLLSRSPIDLNLEPVRALISGSRVLVTGAGGSIGSELARQVAALGPASLVLYERYENTLHDLVHDLDSTFGLECVHPVIGDVTDRARVRQVMERHRPQIVFHAAAHKHVPLMEHNPCEAIKNNVFGTATLAQAAVDHGVERFIFISTDKAVNPSSVMGASKRVAELILQGMSAQGRTRFAAVRFGNVLGSNGSVLPRFIEQIRAGGPVTVTHPEMRRYFMLIPEAVQLVLHAATLNERGMIYVLEMGDQIKLVDLARHVIRLAGFVPDREIPLSFIGLRPGEKLYEELVGSTEVAEPSPIPKIMQVRGTAPSDLRRLAPELEALIQAAVAGDRDVVLHRLHEMIPTLPAPMAPAEPAPIGAPWPMALPRAVVASVVLAAITLLHPAPARAQDASAPETAGLRAGPLTVLPAIRISNLGYDSNANNRSIDDQPRGDWTTTVSPSVDTWVQSPYFRLRGRSAFDVYYFRTLTDLRSLDGDHSGRADVFLGRVALRGDGQWIDTRHQEDLEIDAVASRRQQRVRAGAELKLSGKTSVELFADRNRLRYQPDSLYLNTDLAKVLNHSSTSAGLSMRYAVTPLTTFALTAERQRTVFDSADNRDAEDLRIMPSVEFSPFAMVNGRAAFGVQKRRFSQATDGQSSFTGTVALVDLDYTALERTRVSFFARRTLQFSYIAGLADYLESGLGGSLAQLLGDRWEVSGDVGRYRLDYRQAVATAGATATAVPNETVLMTGADLRWRRTGARRHRPPGSTLAGCDRRCRPAGWRRC